MNASAQITRSTNTFEHFTNPITGDDDMLYVAIAGQNYLSIELSGIVSAHLDVASQSVEIALPENVALLEHIRSMVDRAIAIAQANITNDNIEPSA
jgi:hypothetical protein